MTGLKQAVANTPNPWADEVVRAADVVVTIGCGDGCPIFLGKRYLNWILYDVVLPEIAHLRDPDADPATPVVQRVRSMCGFPTRSWCVRSDPSVRRLGRPRLGGASDAEGGQLLGRGEGFAVADGDLLRDLRQRPRTRRPGQADQREVRRAARRDLAVPVLHRRAPAR